MHIRPSLSALSRHRSSALLITLEIALACAVLCNACFLIGDRLDNMRVDSGIDEASLAVVRLDGHDEQSAADLNARMLAGLGAIPGVQSVSIVNAVPFGQRAGTAGVTLDREGKHFAEVYVGSRRGSAATFQEFGTVEQPARPYLRPAWEATKLEALKIVEEEMGAEIERAAKRLARKAAKLAKG